MSRFLFTIYLSQWNVSSWKTEVFISFAHFCIPSTGQEVKKSLLNEQADPGN